MGGLKMNKFELEIGLLQFRCVLKSLKDHCEEHEDCKECVFCNEYGLCILDTEPNKYDIEKIEKCIREDVKRKMVKEDGAR